MTLVKVRGVSAGYGGIDVLRGIDLTVPAGTTCVVLGPNGAGKSTLVRALAGTLQPRIGAIEIDGTPLSSLDRRAIARLVALVPQQVEVAFGFTVGEVVMMGRAPHQGAWMEPSKADRAAVDRAMEACELAALAKRRVAELSGGEQKRVAIARALAQEAKVLVLDEVGAYLDVRHALAVHEVVEEEVRSRGLACVAVLHDLNAAARYADQVALLKDGRLVDAGRVEDVMTYRKLTDLFSSELYVGVNELDQTRYFLPVRPRRPS